MDTKDKKTEMLIQKSDTKLTSPLTTDSNSPKSLQSENSPKRRKTEWTEDITHLGVTNEEINLLLEDYNPIDYNFKKMAKPFLKQLKERGIMAPQRGVPSELPLVYKLYLQGLKKLIQVVLIYTIIHAGCIYFVAYLGVGISSESLSDILDANQWYYFIVTPSNFVYKTKGFYMLEHLMKPALLLSMSCMFISGLRNFENKMLEAYVRRRMMRIWRS